MKYRILLLSVLLSLTSIFTKAQEIRTRSQKKAKKGIIYFAGGTQRIWYTNSDIHVHRTTPNPPFDFTLYNVKAKDEGGFKWKTAPQFSYTVGYYFKKKNFGLEYHYDHIKYFVTQNQVVHMNGSINGTKYNQDTTLVPEFFKMEHSDGANYAMVNFVKWFPLTMSRDNNFGIQVLAKAGVGVVNPKTNTTIMGVHRDDRYHISGFVTGVEAGLRFNFFKTIIATASYKGTYANYNDFLIAGGKGSQKWFAGQFNYMIGAQFPL
ncbi:MAG: hypothetical protein ACJ75B_07985 [Flavisolibacter sp.]